MVELPDLVLISPILRNVCAEKYSYFKYECFSKSSYGDSPL